MTQTNAIGIIFANVHDEVISELSEKRTMASVPFGGRYRMIDFCLSGMANSGIRNIGVLVRRNYQSLMDHLGNGREWDLSSKRGGLVIFPPYGYENEAISSGKLAGLKGAIRYLEKRKETLVVMSDCDVVCNINFKHLIKMHRESGADVTTVYEKAEIEEGMLGDNIVYTMDSDERVVETRIQDYKEGMQNISMHVYVIGRELLISILREAKARNLTYFEKDYLSKTLQTHKVQGYHFDGYRSRIYDMRSYFMQSMRLLNAGNLEKLFPKERAVYTKVRDEAPVRYAIGCEVKNSIVADGCVIEGHVEDSVIFRGVRIGKNAHVKNCIIMQGSEVQADAQIENIITDKNVKIGEGQALRGAKSYPIFIAKGQVVT